MVVTPAINRMLEPPRVWTPGQKEATIMELEEEGDALVLCTVQSARRSEANQTFCALQDHLFPM